jgi:hypothetical protein
VEVTAKSELLELREFFSAFPIAEIFIFHLREGCDIRVIPLFVATTIDGADTGARAKG